MPKDARLPDWRRRLAAAGQALLDLFYPPRCPGCGRVGFTFCDACQARIELPPAPACLRCGQPAETEHLCPTCRATPSHLDRITSSAIFAHPLRDAIHDLKYNDGRSLARPLGARMAASWRQGSFAADVIIPVPLHTARLAERGYNQSALLARIMSQEIGVPIDESRSGAREGHAAAGDAQCDRAAGERQGCVFLSGQCLGQTRRAGGRCVHDGKHVGGLCRCAAFIRRGERMGVHAGAGAVVAGTHRPRPGR